MPEETFGQWLTRLMTLQGLSVAKLRLQIINPDTGEPISQPSISGWRGDTGSLPKGSHAIQLASALGVKIEELFDRVDLEQKRRRAVRNGAPPRSMDDQLRETLAELEAAAARVEAENAKAREELHEMISTVRRQLDSLS